MEIADLAAYATPILTSLGALLAALGYAAKRTSDARLKSAESALAEAQAALAEAQTQRVAAETTAAAFALITTSMAEQSKRIDGLQEDLRECRKSHEIASLRNAAQEREITALRSDVRALSRKLVRRGDSVPELESASVELALDEETQ